MIDPVTLVAFSLAAFGAATAATMMGFGVGTSLTPLFALVYRTHIAVMLVAVIHFLTNLFRLTLFRRHVDLGIVRRFGILSILGALAGSWGQVFIQSDWLKVLLGVLLIVLGGLGMASGGAGWHFPRRFDQIGGLLSGLLGGLLGNQGALRGAYLVNYDVSKEGFIATAAIIAVFIDATRLPVYLFTQWGEVVSAWPLLLATAAAAYAGTLVGQRLVGRVSQTTFRQVVNGMIALFGMLMIAQGTWATAGATEALVVSAALALGLAAWATWNRKATIAKERPSI